MINLKTYLELLSENHRQLIKTSEASKFINLLLKNMGSIDSSQDDDLFSTNNERSIQPDLLGELYQNNLKNNEPKKDEGRKSLGQYYTPHAIVRLMWLLVIEVIKKDNDELDIPNNLLNIIDPFMGSGRFLLEALFQIRELSSDQSFEYRSNTMKIEDRLHGIEIDPTARLIAEINILDILDKSISKQLSNEYPIGKIDLLRANSFTIDFDQYLCKRKLKNKIDIVISNPPYGYMKPTKQLKQLIPYAYPSYNFDHNGSLITFDRHNIIKGKIPETERNRGSIKEMYAFSFGVADHFVTNNGIICFIVPNSVLNLPSFKWMRYYWLNNYILHYIINFNKVGEVEDSMFAPDAAISTAIIVMQKKNPPRDYEISYLDLSNLKSVKEKYEYFHDIRWKVDAKDRTGIISFTSRKISDVKFQNIAKYEFKTNPDYEFIIRDETIKKIEENSQFLGNFGKFIGGIQTGKDEVFVGKSKDEVLGKVDQWICTNQVKYKVHSDMVRSYIIHENIQNFGISGYEYVYYDKALEAISPIRSSMRLRKEDEQTCRSKLVVGAKSFYVDETGSICNKNAIDKKNLYFLLNESEDILYFLAALLNSSVSKYYRDKTQIDNYKRFPIKKIGENSPLFKNIVKLSKIIHSLVKARNLTHNILSERDSTAKLELIDREINQTIDLLDIVVFSLYFEIDVGDLDNIDRNAIYSNTFVHTIIHSFK